MRREALTIRPAVSKPPAVARDVSLSFRPRKTGSVPGGPATTNLVIKKNRGEWLARFEDSYEMFVRLLFPVVGHLFVPPARNDGGRCAQVLR